MQDSKQRWNFKEAIVRNNLIMTVIMIYFMFKDKAKRFVMLNYSAFMIDGAKWFMKELILS